MSWCALDRCLLHCWCVELYPNHAVTPRCLTFPFQVGCDSFKELESGVCQLWLGDWPAKVQGAIVDCHFSYGVHFRFLWKNVLPIYTSYTVMAYGMGVVVPVFVSWCLKPELLMHSTTAWHSTHRKMYLCLVKVHPCCIMSNCGDIQYSYICLFVPLGVILNT